jgi:protein-disulfide isomerase
VSTLHPPITDQDHSIGSAAAKCTLVEYGDYQCPSCGEAYPIVKRLRQQFADDIRFVFRNFPLSEMHAQAEHAAETAMFAGKSGKFWEMHDLLYEHQQRLGDDGLFDLAGGLQLDVDRLRESLAARTYMPAVKADFMGGVRSGVNGTPTFFINGQRHDAGFDLETLSTAIQALKSSARGQA